MLSDEEKQRRKEFALYALGEMVKRGMSDEEIGELLMRTVKEVALEKKARRDNEENVYND